MIALCSLIASSWPLYLPLLSIVYIDGPMPESDLRQILPEPEAAVGCTMAWRDAFVF